MSWQWVMAIGDSPGTRLQLAPPGANMRPWPPYIAISIGDFIDLQNHTAEVRLAGLVIRLIQNEVQGT